MFALIIYSLVAVVTCYIFLKIKLYVSKLLTLMKLPTAGNRHLIFGNLSWIGHGPEEIFKILRKSAKAYYPIYILSFLHLSVVHMLSPEDFEMILSNTKHNTKGIFYNTLHNWLGTGLLTSSGKKWATRRKILTPAFHFNILQNFVNVFNEKTVDLVEGFRKDCHRPFICINSHIADFTLKTIVETAMGTELQDNTKEGEAYKQAIIDFAVNCVYRSLRPWLLYDIFNFFSPNYFHEMRVAKILHNFSERVIAERQKTFKNIEVVDKNGKTHTKKKCLAMLDLLLKVQKEEGTIDNKGIREEVDTFMFEGHDTTATALCFALMLLACNKHVQENIRQEMGAILGDLHKTPTYYDLQNMKYLERSIKEVLRLYPSVHFVSRKLGEDVKTTSGYCLPKDSSVNVMIFDIHRNPFIYPDPEKFDPDRFLPENSQKRHPFAYIPFSAGPRNCIGQKFAMLEMKAGLCGILANFILEPVDTPSTVIMRTDLVLRTTNDIKVKFIARDRTV